MLNHKCGTEKITKNTIGTRVDLPTNRSIMKFSILKLYFKTTLNN